MTASATTRPASVAPEVCQGVGEAFEGHTPGPWFIDMTQPGKAVVYGPNGSCKEEHQANARLIAAAPDLLRERDEARALVAELVEAVHGLLNVEGAVAAGVTFGAWKGLDPVHPFDVARAALGKVSR